MMKEIFISTFFCIFYIQQICSVVLSQRTELSLNGVWDFTPVGKEKTNIEVPDYWDTRPEFLSVKQAIYERIVTVPGTDDWSNKIIKLEFEGVNFITDVYINNELAASHIGGWIPFSIDITKFAISGQSFNLKLDVKGGCFEPVVDADTAPQWPVGFNGQERRWGIVFDVWLRAYGKIHFDDVFIQTSYREKNIRVEYEVKNEFATSKNFQVKAKVISAINPTKKQFELASNSVTLKPGETQVVIIEKPWTDPVLWSPANPYLYYLQSEIVEVGSKGSLIDQETRRFGFREIWTSGNKLMFNGHPMTIMGTNIVQHSEFHDNQRYWYLSPESWNTTIDRLMQLNIRTVRFHMQPAPKYILDIADERGLLVMDESAIYAREYILKSNKKVYLENCKKWIEPWIKARRNHPSIIVWNAENEMGVGWLKWMTNEEIKSLGDEIRKYDKSRPVNYDGDGDVGDAMVNFHYPEGYAETVKGSIYSWANNVYKDKPTGIGEFITHYGKYGNENQWWQGTWVRGLRYLNYADIRPYRHDWAIIRSDMDEKMMNLKNGFSPVALFDKEYDDLGVDPLMNKNYPLLNCGDIVTRTLIVYNDEFADTLVEVEVLIKSTEIYQALYNYTGERTGKQKIVAQGRRTYIVPLGRHFDIPYTFQVPAITEGFVDMFEIEFIARKNGEVKFRETKRFSLRNLEYKSKSSTSVELGDLKLPLY
jgi:beta-galactosidase/beta-glucuronidase